MLAFQKSLQNLLKEEQNANRAQQAQAQAENKAKSKTKGRGAQRLGEEQDPLAALANAIRQGAVKRPTKK
jgi:hypothetical protein